jgi:hypothetical protein
VTDHVLGVVFPVGDLEGPERLVLRGLLRHTCFGLALKLVSLRLGFGLLGEAGADLLVGFFVYDDVEFHVLLSLWRLLVLTYQVYTSVAVLFLTLLLGKFSEAVLIKAMLINTILVGDVDHLLCLLTKYT